MEYCCANPKPHPHALCLPFPVQSHIKAMLKLAKLLHHKGFHITFVTTEYNHKRFLKTKAGLGGPDDPLGGGDRFRFETIPDGMPPSEDPDAGQDIPALCISTTKNFSAPVLDLVKKINDRARGGPEGVVSDPPVSCVVVDGFLSFVASAAQQQLRIPVVKLFTIAACGLVGFQQFRSLLEKGLIPLKDESSLTNGYLDNTIIDCVPGMKGLRLRDLPSNCRTTNPNELMFQFLMNESESAHEASSVVIQTFNALEQEVLDTLSTKLPNLYAIGPLEFLLESLREDPLKSIQYNLWKEETQCIKWLDSQNLNSVIYVNFGSLAVLTPQQVAEFGWGLANSNYPFLWVIRSDLVVGKSTCLSNEFLIEIEERSMIISWCPQEEVLNHPSIGGFLTHCGWNSILESLSNGVPMLCYPVFAEQQTNCWFTCKQIGAGLEIENEAKRDRVEELVRELMEGEKGKQMRNKAMEIKKLAKEATAPYGSSSINFDNLVSQVLLQ